jgi:hypothetical protein
LHSIPGLQLARADDTMRCALPREWLDVLLVRQDEEELAIDAIDETADIRACRAVDDHRFATGTLEHRAVSRRRETRIDWHVAMTPRQSAKDAGKRRGASVGHDGGQGRPGIAGMLQHRRGDGPGPPGKLPVRKGSTLDLERWAVGLLGRPVKEA